MITLSIVIPTLGRAASLQRLLASIEAQTVAPLETIVVDQNPEGFLTLSAPVVHLRMDEPNAAAARNYGYLVSRGTHILFVDDDELLPPDFVGRLLAIFGARTDVRCLWPAVLDTDSEPPVTDRRRLRRARRVGGGGVTFERECFRLAGGYDEILFRVGRGSEDWELSARMRARGLQMWTDETLFVFHAAQVDGGCAVRSDPYVDVRASAVRAAVFRARIAAGAPFHLRFRDLFPLLRAAFLSGFGRPDGRRSVVRRPLWHLQLLLREIRATRELVEAHAARYADPASVDHLTADVSEGEAATGGR